MYDLLLNGDTSADEPLQPGDVIFVPVVEKQVSISGAVRRPAKYELRSGETLTDVITLAGGTLETSSLDFIRLERLDAEFHPIVRNLDLRSDGNFQIQPGDVVSVGFARSRVRNVISLVGSIERVGDYEWKKGVKLSDLIRGREDFLRNIDLNYGLIRRILPSGNIECLNFEPARLTDVNIREEIYLEPNDLVYFFERDADSRRQMIKGVLTDLRKQSSSKRFRQNCKNCRICPLSR